MISVAGIRGVVGESLRTEDFLDYARAYMATVESRRIVLGRDTRLSGEMLRHLVLSAAIDAGLEVHDLGVVPTPTVGLMVRELRAGGGVMISASHNPPEWNGLKFFSPGGSFISGAQYRQVAKRFEQKRFRTCAVEKLGSVTLVLDPIGPHLEKLLRALPVRSIRRRKFRVVLDNCNGAGLELAQELFRELGVELGAIHVDRDRKFERVAEPLPGNLGKLRKAVVKFGADVGFALDPDADRLAIVDETGRPIGEERTIVLASEYLLRRSRKPVVVNLSTTRAIDDVAASHGVTVRRTPIGEINVVTQMKKLGAVVGGEGNGGVIYTKVHPGRDSATGMGIVLALMAEERTRSRKARTLSEINASIPDYTMIKEKLALPDRRKIEPALKRLLRNAAQLAALDPNGKPPRILRADGIKLDLADRWVHVRASGTEPIVRIFAEAPTRPAASKLIDWAKESMR